MKLKFTWIPFVLSFVITLPIKLLITTNLGQYFPMNFDKEILSCVLFWIAITFALIIIIMCFVAKNVPKRLEIKKDIFLSAVTAILGVVVTLNGVLGLKDIFINAQEQSFINFLLGITAVLSGIVFFIMAVCFYLEKNIFQKRLASSVLVPVVWAVTYLVSVFIVHHTSTAMVGIEMFDVLCAVFLLLFIFSLSKFFVHIDKSNVIKRIYAFGMPTVMFLILESTSDLYNNSEYMIAKTMSTQILFRFVAAVFILYILIYIVSLFWYVKADYNN